MGDKTGEHLEPGAVEVLPDREPGVEQESVVVAGAAGQRAPDRGV